MKLTNTQKFFIVLAAFLILGIPFKVMVLVEGFTEVRPVNAVPPLAGLICGPIGALACGLGNVISDYFGTWNSASFLGLISNMLSAYIPYRLWHIYSKQSPNVHTPINILKYLGICYLGSLVGAWALGLGMHYCLNQWMPEMFTYVFFNNYGFSIVFGIPLLIMLTMKDVNVECEPAPKHYILLKNEKVRLIYPILYTIMMSFFLITISFLNISPVGQPIFAILSILGLIGLIPILI